MWRFHNGEVSEMTDYITMVREANIIVIEANGRENNGYSEKRV